jgi:hypothetical protein
MIAGEIQAVLLSPQIVANQERRPRGHGKYLWLGHDSDGIDKVHVNNAVIPCRATSNR